MKSEAMVNPSDPSAKPWVETSWLQTLIVPLLLSGLAAPGAGHLWLRKNRIAYLFFVFAVLALGWWCASAMMLAQRRLGAIPPEKLLEPVAMAMKTVYPITMAAIREAAPWAKRLLGVVWALSFADTCRWGLRRRREAMARRLEGIGAGLNPTNTP